MLYSYRRTKRCIRKCKKCECAERTYARVSYTTSVEIVHEVKQSQPGQKSRIHLAFQLVRVDGRSITILRVVGYVGSHGGSSEELRNAFPLILYTASKNQKQQVL